MMMPDCGFDLTGSALDVAARVPTDLQNGAVTVSWEPNEDTVISKTATWTWRTAELSFEKDMYTSNEPIKFTLHDRDLWIHHAEFFTYWMKVYILILMKVESLFQFRLCKITIMVLK